MPSNCAARPRLRKGRIRPPWPETKRQAPGGDPSDASPSLHLSLPDFITTYPRGSLSKSAKGDRVLIYATKTGTVRSYRSPRGAEIPQATVWQRYILIMSNGPGTTQLAAYDLDHDRWAIHDLPRGIEGIFNTFTREDQPIVLMAPSFQGSPLTQLAIFDLKHFRWSVQDLIEPLNERLMPYANPIAYGNVAIYVLAGTSTVTVPKQGPGMYSPGNAVLPRGIGGQGPQVTNDSAAVSQDGRSMFSRPRRADGRPSIPRI